MLQFSGMYRTTRRFVDALVTVNVKYIKQMKWRMYLLYQNLQDIYTVFFMLELSFMTSASSCQTVRPKIKFHNTKKSRKILS